MAVGGRTAGPRGTGDKSLGGLGFDGELKKAEPRFKEDCD